MSIRTDNILLPRYDSGVFVEARTWLMVIKIAPRGLVHMSIV